MSQSMRLLHRLVTAGYIQVVICQMVLREYDTKRLSDISAKLQSTRDGIRDISKIFSKSNIKLQDLIRLDNETTELQPILSASLQETTRAWLESFKVEVISPCPKIHDTVWDDYFAGKGAFKRPKNRDDIPDAIIGRSLERLVDDGTPLTFICKDGQLKDFMAKIPGVRVFSELPELTSSIEFVAMLEELDAQDQVIEAFKVAISSEAFQQSVIKYFSAHESDFYYACWQGEEIENQSELPLTVYGEANASGLIISSIEDIEFGPVACINPRHYVIPISFEADAIFTFTGDYGEWLHASDIIKNWVTIESANGDGLCDFSVRQTAGITGQVVVHLLENVEPENLLIHAKYIGVDDSPLDVEFVPGKISL